MGTRAKHDQETTMLAHALQSSGAAVRYCCGYDSKAWDMKAELGSCSERLKHVYITARTYNCTRNHRRIHIPVHVHMHIHIHVCSSLSLAQQQECYACLVKLRGCVDVLDTGIA